MKKRPGSSRRVVRKRFANAAESPVASSDREYAEAVGMVLSMRDTVVNLRDGQVKYLSLPAGKISGDFFCTAEHPTKGWFCLLADATGHGLPAAIFGVNTPMLFRQAVQRGLSLPEIFAQIHGFLSQLRLGGYFVCGLLVRIDDREIEVVNAGMPDAMLLAPDGRLIDAFPSRHLPFGITATTDVTVQRLRLVRGDHAALLLYSDGLSDLGSISGNPLGTAGALAVAASVGATGSFDDLAERIARQGAPLEDDISIALIKLPFVGGVQGAESERPLSQADAAMEGGVGTAARNIVEHFDHGMVLTDAEQRILYVNPAFTRVTGYALAEAVGQTPRLLHSGRHGAAFYSEMWRKLQETGAWSGEVWNRRKDGLLYVEWLSIKAIRDEAGETTRYLATFFDMTGYRQRESAAHALVQHDPLTGLIDRMLLKQRGEQAIRRADLAERSLGVLVIDLDRFKSINDTLGHDIGDAVLIEVARRFAGALRAQDTLARLGDDEFVCLLPDLSVRQDAALVCGNLLGVLAEPVAIAGHHLRIGASIGVSAYPSDGLNFDDLIVYADRAMLRAKQAGGNIYRFFSSHMAIAADRQLELEARLAAALHNGEFELHYQPKLDMHSRQIVGAEALVRWRDPQHGLVPPGIFIPIAEKCDLISGIGNWVLAEACAALSRLEKMLPEHFHIAVNVSPMQLLRCDLAAEVARALAENGVAACRLQLEVTESLFIDNAQHAEGELSRIAEQGVSIALDDFGTGYSNLGLLAQLPVDSFKLDQSFVRDVHVSSQKSAIARAANHLATGLGKDIVAEGIESCLECMQLKKLGYRIGQGYVFGKPMPEAQFVDFLERGAPCQCPA